MKKKHALFQVSLKVLLRDARGRTLILRSKPGGMLRKSWDFPGGRMDMHEQRRSISEIIKREIKEEIGNSVRYTFHPMPVTYGRLMDFSKRYGHHPPILYLFFEAVYHGGKIIISPEHRGYQWIAITKKNCTRYFTGVMREAMRQYLKRKNPESGLSM